MCRAMHWLSMIHSRKPSQPSTVSTEQKFLVKKLALIGRSFRQAAKREGEMAALNIFFSYILFIVIFIGIGLNDEFY